MTCRKCNNEFNVDAFPFDACNICVQLDYPNLGNDICAPCFVQLTQRPCVGKCEMCTYGRCEYHTMTCVDRHFCSNYCVGGMVRGLLKDSKMLHTLSYFREERDGANILNRSCYSGLSRENFDKQVADRMSNRVWKKPENMQSKESIIADIKSKFEALKILHYPNYPYSMDFRDLKQNELVALFPNETKGLYH